MGSKIYTPDKINENVLTILAKGDNSYGNISYLNLPNNYTKLFINHYQCFALDIYNTLYSWGGNDYFQGANGKAENYGYADNINYDKKQNFINTFSILSKEPTLSKSIYNKLQTYFTSPLSFPIRPQEIREISCGDGFTIFGDTKGDLYSCGRNDKGQLGYEITNDIAQIINGVKCQSNVIKINGIANITHITSGSDFTYALDIQGQYYSWGNNTHCQLGRDNTKKYSFAPENAEYVNNSKNIDEGKINTICCGWTHACCLTTNDDVFIWGNPFYDYDKSYKDISLPMKVNINKALYRVVELSSGFHHFSMIVNHVSNTTKYSGLTFGANDCGQLGYKTESDYTTQPMPVKFPEKDSEVIDTVCGGFHTICRGQGNTVYGFGFNGYKEIGDYDGEVIDKPIKWNYDLVYEKLSEFDRLEKDVKLEGNEIKCGNRITVGVYKNKNTEDENKLKNDYVGIGMNGGAELQK